MEKPTSSARFDVLKESIIEPQQLRYCSEQEIAEYLEKLITKTSVLREETELFRRYTERTTQGKGFKSKEKENAVTPKDSMIDTEQPLVLTTEQKADIASHEADELKQALVRVGVKAKEFSDKYECKIKESHQFKEYVRTQETLFRHKILQDGNVPAERLLKWFEDSIKNLESMCRAAVLSNAANRHSVKALDATLKKQKELGENLTQVDFMKLEIENRLLVEACEKCKEEMQQINLENNKTSLAIAHLNQRAIELSKFITDGQHKLTLHSSAIGKLEKEKNGIQIVTNRLRQWNQEALGSNLRCPSVAVYIQIEKDIELLEQLKKETLRKIQIIDMSGMVKTKTNLQDDKNRHKEPKRTSKSLPPDERYELSVICEPISAQ